ncbi:MAG TPA: prenyltransferase/squalene oxidase repeat-containing protein, partial [Vicinamibacterales bacterium]|nr:prenyltransferase/squalene oxidase repeat-containing protein [Vicinamibacterales bacterium]
MAGRSAVVEALAGRLRDRRASPNHWEGRLASSALAGGTAVLALHLTSRSIRNRSVELDGYVRRGIAWLREHQNADGGWGDTIRSRSNISTTAIVWASLSLIVAGESEYSDAICRAQQWLDGAAGGTTPAALRAAILRRYGTDHTFSVPILTVLALTGKLGSEAAITWRSVPQLPFELAALPHHWFQHLRLPVVSYALPALIAIGQVRHHFAPSRNPATSLLRNAVRARTLRLLRAMQPDSGGYLEATPLTSFVVMSLSGAGLATNPVVTAGVKFLTDSMRDDGSWPIDTNLATWVTTLSTVALGPEHLTVAERAGIREWLLTQQTRHEHPFTHAAPGAWAWTPLSGGVPDADDTSGALLALAVLGDIDARVITAAAAGARWLMRVQNADGGVPTFCRGWGTLPFDRSTPEITAHAIRAWSAWADRFDSAMRSEVMTAANRALAFLERTQRPDGSWIPLWFGNEDGHAEENPVYGTARALAGLNALLVRDAPCAVRCRERALEWLLSAQNDDGGWGGDRGVGSSVEETGVALAAIAGGEGAGRCDAAIEKGRVWL